MELQLVSYEQAKTLKELGFPDTLSYQVCPYSYFGKDLIDIHNNDISALNPKWREVKDEDICFAPTLELVAKWLREEKKINVQVLEYVNEDRPVDISYIINVYFDRNDGYRHATYIDTPLDDLMLKYSYESKNW